VNDDNDEYTRTNVRALRGISGHSVEAIKVYASYHEATGEKGSVILFNEM
jgi:hypothetical protein